MPNLKTLQEQRGEALAEIQRLRDVITTEDRDFSADERTAWEASNSHYDQISDRIAIIERTRTLEADKPVVDVPAKADAPDYRSMLMSSREIDIPLMRSAPRTVAEARAMSTTTDSEGGYLVPTDLGAAVEVALLEFGGVREVATVIRTETGAQIDLPTVDDSGNTGSSPVAENAGLGTTDVTFGVKSLNAYKVSSDLVKIPFELLQDSAFDLASLLGRLLGERIARNSSALYTTGTGSSQPNGVVTASAAGVTAAGVAAITSDELIDLYHSVGRAYRRNGTWMMADSTAKYVRKLKDGDNQYLWQPGLSMGLPDTLFGAPVITNDDMAALATGNKTVLFGDFSRYYIRDVGAVRLIRLNERFADNDQIAWVAILRTDGELADAGTNPIKHLVQA
jgi:HK97 family phage major capsid protein